MAIQETTANHDDLHRDMMHLMETYDELHSLVPDGMCHHLLGYINADMKQVLIRAMRALSEQESDPKPAN